MRSCIMEDAEMALATDAMAVMAVMAVMVRRAKGLRARVLKVVVPMEDALLMDVAKQLAE